MVDPCKRINSINNHGFKPVTGAPTSLFAVEDSKDLEFNKRIGSSFAAE